MEAVPRTNQNEQATERYSSVIEYLCEDDGQFLTERAQEVIDTAREMLLRDESGNIRGVVDDSYFNANDKGHLVFILESTEFFDDVTVDEGVSLEDIIERDKDVQRFIGKDAQTVRSLRALIVAETMLALHDTAGEAELDCA